MSRRREESALIAGICLVSAILIVVVALLVHIAAKVAS